MSKKIVLIIGLLTLLLGMFGVALAQDPTESPDATADVESTEEAVTDTAATEIPEETAATNTDEDADEDEDDSDNTLLIVIVAVVALVIIGGAVALSRRPAATNS